MRRVFFYFRGCFGVRRDATGGNGDEAAARSEPCWRSRVPGTAAQPRDKRRSQGPARGATAQSPACASGSRNVTRRYPRWGPASHARCGHAFGRDQTARRRATRDGCSDAARCNRASPADGSRRNGDAGSGRTAASDAGATYGGWTSTRVAGTSRLRKAQICVVTRVANAANTAAKSRPIPIGRRPKKRARY